MNLFRQMMEKPWLRDGGFGEQNVVDIHDGRSFFLPTGKLGLRVFLTVVLVLFSLFIIVYTERMLFSDWRSTPIPWLLWPNTGILILSSVAMQWAWRSARRGQMENVKRGLTAGGVLTFGFLIGQLLAWRELSAMGHYVSTGPANAFFYLLTALHGIHLLGGLVAWVRTMIKVRHVQDMAKVKLSIELCTAYWHFLLMIWLILFALLLLT